MICLIEKENPNKRAYLSIGQASKDSLQPGARTFGLADVWIILRIYLTSVVSSLITQMMWMTVRNKNQSKLWAKGHMGHASAKKAADAEGSGKEGLENISERSNKTRFIWKISY